MFFQVNWNRNNTLRKTWLIERKWISERCRFVCLRLWFSNFHEPWHSSKLTDECLIYRDTWVMQYHGKAAPSEGPREPLRGPKGAEGPVWETLVHDMSSKFNFHPTVPTKNLRVSLHYSAVACAENFHGGFIQWHAVVICIWCALFVTSQCDVVFMFSNQCFGEVCWHNINILLHVAYSPYFVSLHRIYAISAQR